MKKISEIILLLLSVFVVSAATPQLTVKKVEQRPVLDGVLDDACWQNKAWHNNFSVLAKPDVKAAVQTRFKICHDDKAIYIGIEADEPVVKPIAEMEPNSRESKSIWKSDSVEIFLDPDGKGNSFYQIFLSSNGRIADAYAEDDNTGQSKFTTDYAWNGLIKAKSKTYKNKWVVEAEIPLAGLKVNRNSPSVWEFNIGRNRYAGGKVEYTSFAPLKSLHFSCPGEFCPLSLDNADLSSLYWNFNEVAYSVVKNNKKLSCEISGKISNDTGKFSIALLRAEFLDTANRIIYHKQTIVPTRNESEQAFKLSVPIADKPANHMLLTVSSLSSSEVPVAVFTKKVDLKYNPLQIKIIQPAYRNNIYMSQKCGRIIAELTLDNPAEYSALTVTLCGPDKYNTQKTINAVKKKNIIEFDASVLKAGSYSLKTALINGKGRVNSPDILIRKLPYLEGEVWLDKNGTAYVDGKEFLPFGWYRGTAEKKDGFTVVQSYARFSSEEHMQNYLDNMHKVGLKAIVIPFQLLSKDAYADKLFHPENQRNTVTEKQRRQIIKVVNKFRKHPGLFGWYISDEPEGRDISTAWLEEAYRLIRETDPYHPCILVNYSPAGIKTYFKACDILAPDCYPNYVKGSKIPIGKKLQTTSYYVDTAAKLRPAWLVPQAFCWYYTQRPEVICRPPSYDEIRNQIYQTFASNGKGILLYCYHDWSSMYYSLRQGIDYIADEVAILKPYLLEKNLNVINFKTNLKKNYLVAALKKYKNHYCLLAINNLPVPLTATFSFKPGILPADLYPAGSDSAKKISNNTFVVKLAPYETQIYLTDRQIAKKLSPQKKRKHLSTLDKARYKKGNLVAMGEIMRQEYKDFLKKQPLSPVNLQTSSNAYSFFQRDCATEYCLFDGMTDNYFLSFVWGPKKTDKSPWLLLTFPKPISVNKVVLYSLVSDNIAALSDFTVQAEVNGKFKTAGKVTKNNAARCMVAFPALKTRRIKILINKFKKPVKGWSRILTEIEVYGPENNK